MKAFTLFIIKAYQLSVSPFLAALFPTAGCRSYPTCSSYTYNSVENYGVIRGLKMGFLKVIKCNPWGL